MLQDSSIGPVYVVAAYVSGQSSTCILLGPINRVGFWSRLPAGKLPVGWLERLIQVGERSRILSHGGVSRDWSVPLGGWPHTSWSSL